MPQYKSYEFFSKVNFIVKLRILYHTANGRTIDAKQVAYI